MNMTMPLSAKQKAKFAFSETANQVSLFPFLLVACVLTLDPFLLAAGLLMEGLYLWWAACKSVRYQKRAESQMVQREFRSVRDKNEEFLLDRVLLLVTLAGFVVILFFGFGKHLLTDPYQFLSHSEGWEAGALVWTACFTFYYMVKFGVSGKRVFDAVWGVSLFAIVVTLITLAWSKIGEPITHVWFVWGIGLCFLLTDLLASSRLTKKEPKLSKASLWWADVPMVTTLSILLGYLYFHHDTEHPDVFVSGVIACQLLMSNAIFVAMEFEFLEPSGTRLPVDKVPATTGNLLVQPDTEFPLNHLKKSMLRSERF